MKINKIKALLTISLFASSIFAVSYSYDDLYKSMLSNNPELMLLSEEYARSKLDVKDAYAGLGPTIQAQASGTFMTKPPIDEINVNVDDILSAMGMPSGQTGQTVKVYDGMGKTSYNFELSMTQPVFTWGKVTNAIKLYKQLSSIKETQIESKRKELKTELESRLTTFSYLQNMNQLIEEEKTYVERLVKVSEDSERTGMILHQDVVDAKIQAKELEIAQQDIKEQINNQLFEIINLTGIEDLSVNQISYAANEDVITSVMGKNRDEVMEAALSGKQLSIKLLTQLKEVSNTSVKIAKGSVNWKPDIALQASLGYGGAYFPFAENGWKDNDDLSANLTVGIRTTIWDGGKKVRDVSRKISESKTAEINQLDARASIKKTINEQWNTIDVCTMKIDYQDLKIEACDSKIVQKQKLFDSGYGSETDVLNAKIDRCNQKIEKEKQSLSRVIACMTINLLCE